MIKEYILDDLERLEQAARQADADWEKCQSDCYTSQPVRRVRQQAHAMRSNGGPQLAGRPVSHLTETRAQLQRETPSGWMNRLQNTSDAFAMTLPNESSPYALVLSRDQSPLGLSTSSSSPSKTSNPVLRKWLKPFEKKAEAGFRGMAFNIQQDILAQRKPRQTEGVREAIIAQMVMGAVQGTNTLIKPVTIPAEITGIVLAAVAHQVCSGGEYSPKVCRAASTFMEMMAQSAPVQGYIEGRERFAIYLERVYGVPQTLITRTLDDSMLLQAGAFLSKGGGILRNKHSRTLALPPKPVDNKPSALESGRDIYFQSVIQEAENKKGTQDSRGRK